ncbi:MAG: cell division protein FtsZ [Lachnospiraceae bacterium]|nr:cell division protein FtsZ [Lachnospiraceae bacterium]
MKHYEPVARIVVLGVGGAGNNAVNRMVEDNVQNVEFVAINTDKQDLVMCKAPVKIAIGEKLTGGRGCGAIPEIGEGAANESKELIRSILRETEKKKRADMVFITCGMGGGTGTGAAPIIASVAKEEGILTVAVVTKPFRFEGKTRMNRAIAGINKLYPNVDTLITIANDRLFQIVDPKDGFKESFAKADEVLKQRIRGITDLINLPSLVNLDFADISTVMRGKGTAHIAIGEGTGEDKVINAIHKAIESPLLETNIDGATDLIVCISGKVSLLDVDTAMKEIEPKLSPDVNIIFGAREDNNKADSVSITIIATGIRDNMRRMTGTYRDQSFGMPMQNNNNTNTNMDMFNYNNMATNGRMQGSMYRDQSQEKPQSPLASFFGGRKQEPVQPVQPVQPIQQNANDGFKSLDNIDVDFSKLNFSKKDGKDISLPGFITKE